MNSYRTSKSHKKPTFAYPNSEFTEAESNLQDLVSEYLQYQEASVEDDMNDGYAGEYAEEDVSIWIWWFTLMRRMELLEEKMMCWSGWMLFRYDVLEHPHRWGGTINDWFSLRFPLGLPSDPVLTNSLPAPTKKKSPPLSCLLFSRGLFIYSFIQSSFIFRSLTNSAPITEQETEPRLDYSQSLTLSKSRDLLKSVSLFIRNDSWSRRYTYMYVYIFRGLSFRTGSL